VEYERDKRYAGQPKYTLPKLVALAVSGYVGFSSVPLRMAAWMGFLATGAGLLLAVWAIYARFADIDTPRGWASTVAIILFVGGVQLFTLGVIGEYLGRVYDEVRQRPLYIIREVTGT
jgi:dolichol-phosphate mannosyltransferase